MNLTYFSLKNCHVKGDNSCFLNLKYIILIRIILKRHHNSRCMWHQNELQFGSDTFYWTFKILFQLGHLHDLYRGYGDSAGSGSIGQNCSLLSRRKDSAPTWPQVVRYAINGSQGLDSAIGIKMGAWMSSSPWGPTLHRGQASVLSGLIICLCFNLYCCSFRYQLY